MLPKNPLLGWGETVLTARILVWRFLDGPWQDARRCPLSILIQWEAKIRSRWDVFSLSAWEENNNFLIFGIIERSLLLSSIKNAKHSVFLTDDFSFHLSLSVETLSLWMADLPSQLNSTSWFTGQNSCLCKLAELHVFDRSDNGLCWQKILSCPQLMAAKREVLDLVFSWVFATLT